MYKGSKGVLERVICHGGQGKEERVMKNALSKSCISFGLFMAIVFCMSLVLADESGTGKMPISNSQIPALIDVSKIKFEIIGTMFVTELEGVGRKFKETEPEKYRGMVVTVRIKKPAGMALKIFNADLPLHYYHGDDYDVMICQGLSSFSTTQDVDRPMQLFNRYGSTSTGTSSTQASEVYLDIFYQYLEPDTGDIYIMIANTMGAHYKTEGWEK